MRDDWPAQAQLRRLRSAARDRIEGLWCVGDAVKQYGNGGTQPVPKPLKSSRCGS